MYREFLRLNTGDIDLLEKIKTMGPGAVEKGKLEDLQRKIAGGDEYYGQVLQKEQLQERAQILAGEGLAKFKTAMSGFIDDISKAGTGFKADVKAAFDEGYYSKEERAMKTLIGRGIDPTTRGYELTPEMEDLLYQSQNQKQWQKQN